MMTLDIGSANGGVRHPCPKPQKRMIQSRNTACSPPPLLDNQRGNVECRMLRRDLRWFDPSGGSTSGGSEGLTKAGWAEQMLSKTIKGHAVKVAIARALRAETAVTRVWIADRLKMGSASYLSKKGAS